MEIRNIVLSAKKSVQNPNVWEIAVKYQARFTPYEVNQRFNMRDSISIREDDPISDDVITGFVGASSFQSNAASIDRSIKIKVSAAGLDTEWGEEELYAIVKLKNTDLPPLEVIKKSRTLDLKP
ncbi:hypothetical protein P1X15_01560 [Runella sp. MFBS21]|uniref:hypothetical protein n=1 Tax=Runella sp. MFBS21 TaxID=3034018 RepID=UPI0023F7A9F0|nr:hypothetical protein [Runella sp. MFBS21]MDF7816252.1 hypothetical protein [Runella sp. MFBS21]